MNAARAFGPAVVSNFPNYHWIVRALSPPFGQFDPLNPEFQQYWVGPGLGSLFASTIYAFLKQYVLYYDRPNATVGINYDPI